MPDNFLWDVFLSHSSKDKTRVRQLAESLRGAGLHVWLNEWVIQPGDDIYSSIEHGLEYSRTLVLCISQTAIDSDWVKLERNTAIFRDPQNKLRRFIPLLLADCRMPDTIRRYAYVDWCEESDEALAMLIQSCQPPKLDLKTRSNRRRTNIAMPTGTMSADSPLYIKREADDHAMLAAQRIAETIVIKAPRQMGKSSLLKSYLAACERAGKRTVLFDFSLLADEDLADYAEFLTLLAQMLWQRLGEPPQAVPPTLRKQHQLVEYIESSLLTAIDVPVVVAFDETDRVLGRAWQSDFFTMLRYWHNQRPDPTTRWSRLGLALVISSEPYLVIKDYLRSPFNVGLQLELRLFNETECQKLNRLYRARLSKAEIARLMELLNGHPHLTHLAFHSLSGPQPMQFSAMLRTAAERGGPFGTHLRALEKKLMDEAGQQLLAAMKQIIKNGKTPNEDAFYRLHGAGLVREDRSRIVPINLLYERFFGTR